MSRSLKSLASSRRLKIPVILMVAALLLAWPLNHYAHNRAEAAMARGDAQSDPNHAVVWYSVANTLDPHNGRILLKLAAADLKTGRSEDALRAAIRSIAHGSGDAGYILKSQALLELSSRQLHPTGRLDLQPA